MKILDSETLDPTKLSAEEQFYAYNGLDCMVTLEVLEALKPKFIASPGSNQSEAGFAYDMARTMQAPSFDATRRGVKIDLHERASRISELENARARCLFIFDQLSAVWEASININSPVQLLEFFYTTLQLKPILIYDRITKQTKPSTNREALEKLQKIERAKPFVDLILAVRDIDKQLQVLRTGIDNGRIHCSYNVCGTLTGRWSSSKSPWGSGSNLQNISDKMRRIFVADPGYKLCQLDLAQAESKVVAYLCLPWGDNYLKACNSGDLHSLTCKLVWPRLPWGTAPDKIIAEQKYYREHSHRDIAKKGGHGSNYYGQPATISMHLKVPVVVGAEFQRLYFKAFPEIPEWHNDVKMRLVKDRFITSPWGRRCHFPGRPWDGETIRSAIAYSPQSAIGDTLNRGYYKLWRRYDPGTIQILTQVHDSILFQYREDEEADLIPLLQKEIVVALEINGQICEIQADAKVGWNWGKRIEYKTSSGRVVENEWGLTDFHGRDLRSPPKKLSMLDRRVC